MIDVHLRALQNKLRSVITDLKDIDHWNNQTAGSELELKPPAVYFDFGKVLWQSSGGVQSGRVTLTVHCVGKNITSTKDKAPDSSGTRSKRFELSNKVLQALQNLSVKDSEGNYAIKSLQLSGSEHDTNHDALTDDQLEFTGQLYYYDTWREKNYTEILLEEVEDERVEEFPVE